ncbi:hypothetical protein F5888DRAFT_582060 [Russula emetica]|nr:hypothetical protein F5888DRAFT_582060 [Russula emetica]
MGWSCSASRAVQLNGHAALVNPYGFCTRLQNVRKSNMAQAGARGKTTPTRHGLSINLVWRPLGLCNRRQCKKGIYLSYSTDRPFGSPPSTATTHVSIAVARLAVLAFLLPFVVFHTSPFFVQLLEVLLYLGCHAIFCVSCSVLAQPVLLPLGRRIHTRNFTPSRCTLGRDSGTPNRVRMRESE